MSEKSFVATQDNKVVTYQGISLGKENASTDFNKICVSGFIEEEFEYSHEFLREKFYKTRIRVARLSGTEDYIPIIVSELLMPIAIESGLKGKYVKAEGQLRSYKKLAKMVGSIWSFSCLLGTSKFMKLEKNLSMLYQLKT